MGDDVPIRKHIGAVYHRPKAALRRVAISFLSATLMAIFSSPPLRAEDTNVEQQIQMLERQNAVLEQKLEKQNESIESLNEKVQELESTNGQPPAPSPQNNMPAPLTGYNFGNVNLSAEGGIAFFNTGPEGFSPDSEFRVDEARLFVEAPIWKEVYFQGEADFATRENTDLTVKVGELYLDWQDLSDLWGRDGQLNVRFGRMYIPFGEEYLTRYAIDDPLISHSVSDLWGYDNGVELYGEFGKFNYVVAVQNGSGANGVQDFNGDKSVAGRIGFDPAKFLHFSVSAMRTGNLSVKNDMISAIWFANGFFQSVGGPGTTLFNVDLVEADILARWSSGHVSAFGGYGHYGDNDPAADNGRDIFYYAAEAEQNLPAKFYVATRFSQALSNKGVPMVGLGKPDYYYDDLTAELWRLSFGLGYRFNGNFLLKVEYSFEGGRDIDGDSRDSEDFFGTEAAFKF
jgi:hypothetical protein